MVRVLMGDNACGKTIKLFNLAENDARKKVSSNDSDISLSLLPADDGCLQLAGETFGYEIKATNGNGLVFQDPLTSDSLTVSAALYKVLRVLTRQADVYYLDEPSYLLQPTDVDSLYKLCQRMSAELGKDIYYTTHTPEMCNRFEDEILVVYGDDTSYGDEEDYERFVSF